MTLPKIHITGKPTYVKIAEDVDFFPLFKKIEAKYDTCFIFESLGEEGKFSRYSILGFAPAHVVSARGTTLFFDGTPYEVENPYASLKEIMPGRTLAKNYEGGLIGYVGYEAAEYFEPSLRLKEHPDFDRFMFGVYTDGLVLDKLTNELFYFYYDADRRPELEALMKEPVPSAKMKVEFIKDGLTEEEHAQIVGRVKEEIRKGNTFQCEVGFKSEYRITGSAVPVYEKLREVNPSPFMYFLKFGDKKVVGASPELLFSLRGGEMTTKPLAGTAPRGTGESDDQRLARELVHDPKERAEHMMLVDLHRNDIGRVAQFGTVRVRELMGVKKFSHVQHISSEIVGLVRPGEDMFSALASNFPVGTVSGAPKIESMRIIERNEAEARGPYGGGVGHFGFNGDCTFALAIRSVFIAGEEAYTQTSGGIVYDSEPQKEYAEIRNKLAAMKKVLKML